MRPRYLFIRILEACNADCFMCGFAHSRDRYRFGLAELADVLSQARALGFGYVRFTGGEPLMHREIVGMVTAVRESGLLPSLITNGASLAKMAPALAEAGLAQAIVSIDGAHAGTHDRYRNIPGLFRRCIDGLYAARNLGIGTRVNTVVGPYNYAQMPILQRVVSEMGARHWELSALKLDEEIRYPDPAHVIEICEPIYTPAEPELVIPMGKRFYGNSETEQRLYFEHGIPPRPNLPRCRTIGNAVYLDGKAGMAFGCSLLPHRDAAHTGGGVRVRGEDGWNLNTPGLWRHVEHFATAGPSICTGCSSSAAGYSDAIAASVQEESWAF